MISDFPVRFGCNRYCATEDIMVLVCPLIFDHVTKGSNEFVSESPLMVSHSPTNLK